MAKQQKKSLGPYRIDGQINVGGMATVYKAFHPATNRLVAVKVLLEHLSLNDDIRQRFAQEAQVVAKLEHAHILPVYDYGQADDRLYLVMRYIEAGTLKERMAAGPMSLPEVNHILQQVGSALDYAHQAGVIHRDVKPSNVLVDDQGDCYLTDFGLAKMMESTVQFTETGVGIGTPAYMSPEQGEGQKADARSDIYALGVMLYEMVVGKAPYEAETPMAVLWMHISSPLPDFELDQLPIPEQVRQVILKAMAKKPGDRFQTVREMVEAFDAAVQTVNGTPSRTPMPAQTFLPPAPSLAASKKRRWIWAVAAIAAISLLCLAALAVTLSLLPFRVRINDGQVQVVRRGETMPAVTMSPAMTASPTLPATKGPALVQPTETPQTPTNTIQAATWTPPPTPSATWTAATPATQTPTALPLTETSTPPPALPVWTDAFSPLVVLDKGGYQAAFSPDGALLAVSGHEITLYDAQTWQPVRTLGRDGAFGIAFSPDGKTLAAIVGPVKLFDVTTGAERLTLPGFEIHTTAASGHFLAFSPDGKTLLVVVDDVVKSFDVESGGERGIILAQGAFAIDLSPDGQTMATAGWGSGLALWDMTSRQQIRVLGDRALGAQRAVFAPDGGTLVSSSTGRETGATIWDVGNGRALGTFDGHEDTINDLAFSPDGRLLATVSRDITVKVWDVATRQLLQTVLGHSQEANSVAFSPDGTLIASSSWDGTTRVWQLAATENAATQEPTRASAGPTMTPLPLSAQAISPENAAHLKQTNSLEQGGTEVAWSPDGRFFAIAGHELIVYDAVTWQQTRRIGSGSTDGIAFSPDGKTLATIMGEVKLFDATTGAELHTLSGTRISTTAASSYFLAFTADGQTLAVVVGEVVRLFDVESGGEVGLIVARGSNAIAFSPDGRLLAAGAWDGLWLWDVESGQQVRALGDRWTSAHRLAFSPDGSMLASSGTGDEPIQFWDVESGRELRNWVGHADTVNSLAFSPDGRLLATASSDLTIKIWNVATGQELQTLTGHTGEIDSLAFSPDGETLASTTWNGPTLLWRALP